MHNLELDCLKALAKTVAAGSDSELCEESSRSKDVAEAGVGQARLSHVPYLGLKPPSAAPSILVSYLDHVFQQQRTNILWKASLSLGVPLGEATATEKFLIPGNSTGVEGDGVVGDAIVASLVHKLMQKSFLGL